MDERLKAFMAASINVTNLLEKMAAGEQVESERLRAARNDELKALVLYISGPPLEDLGVEDPFD
jgi:hypothetical protein